MCMIILLFYRHGKGGPKGNDLLSITHQLSSELNLDSGSLDFLPPIFHYPKENSLEEYFWEQVLIILHRIWHIHTY